MRFPSFPINDPIYNIFFNRLLLKSWCSKKYSIFSKRERKNELKIAFWINKDIKIFRRPPEVCNKSQRVAVLQNRRANAKKESCHSIIRYVAGDTIYFFTMCCVKKKLEIILLFQYFWFFQCDVSKTKFTSAVPTW